MNKKKGFREEANLPNYLKFHVTKPLLRYDYTVVKGALDENYVDNFEEDSFYDEKLELGDSQTNIPINVQPALTKSNERKPNALKRILDGEDSMENMSQDYGGQIGNKVKDEESDFEIQVNDVKAKGENQILLTQLIEKTELSKPERREVFENAEPISQKDSDKFDFEMKDYSVEKNSFRGGDTRASGNGRIDESLIERMERESEYKLSMAEKEHYKEKNVLLNRLGVLEEKYAIVLNTLEHLSPTKKRSEVEESGKENEYDERSLREQREERKKSKKDDSFYQLHQEIMKDREKALQAEVDYIMFNKINFPGGVQKY